MKKLLQSLPFSQYQIRNYKDRKKFNSIHDVTAERKKIVKKVIHRYGLPDKQHRDTLFEEKVYGKTCHIVGVTADSEDSITFIQSAFNTLSTDHVILGGYNYNHMITDRLIREPSDIKILQRIYESDYSPASLFCKSRITEPILYLVNEDVNYIVKKEQKVAKLDMIYEIDHNCQRITTHDYFTIINLAIQRELCKLSFGVPSDLIIFEDLMLNCELEELREICFKVISNVKQQLDFRFNPFLVFEDIREQAKKQIKLFQKELTFMAALLNKYCLSSRSPMLFVHNNFVEFIADNVHKIHFDPESVYNRNPDSSSSQFMLKLQSYIGSSVNHETALENLLEKFAILSLLKNNHLQKNLLLQNENIFSKTIFKPLFDKFSLEEIIARYRLIRSPLKERAGSIIDNKIQNIEGKYREHKKQLLTLPEQIKTQEQRIYDFPTTYQVANKNTQKRLMDDIREMGEKITEIVEKEYVQEDKELFQLHLNGKPTKESVILMDKLLVEAKLRLKKHHLNLPNFHFEALRGIFKSHMKDQILKNHKISRTPKKQLEEMTQNKGTITEITDPKQMEEYMSGPKGKGIPKLSFTMGENGEIQQNPNIDLDGMDVNQWLQKIKKDSFFSEVGQKFEEEREKQDDQSEKFLDEDEIEKSDEYLNNKYYREEVEPVRPKEKSSIPKNSSGAKHRANKKTKFVHK